MRGPSCMATDNRAQALKQKPFGNQVWLELSPSQLVSICMSARPSAPIVWPKYSSKGSEYYISES